MFMNVHCSLDLLGESFPISPNWRLGWIWTIKIKFLTVAYKTRALKERRPPWARQLIIYPYIARIPDLESKHGNPDHPKFLINCFLYYCRAILKISSKSTHNLLRPDFWLSSQHGDPDSCSFYHPGPLHKISSQPVHNLLKNVANRQTKRNKERPTNKQAATKNITSIAKGAIYL